MYSSVNGHSLTHCVEDNDGGTDQGLRTRNNEMFELNDVLKTLPKTVRNEFTNISLEALKGALPACVDFLKAIKGVAKEMSNSRGEVSYNHPMTGFPVIHQEFKVIKKQANIESKYRRIQLVLKKKTNEVDKNGISTALAPNVIHSTDAALLFNVRSRINHEVITIHDSIGSHPNDVDETVNAYASAMYDLATKNIMSKLFESIGTSVKVPYSNTASKEEIEAIKHSRHILA